MKNYFLFGIALSLALMSCKSTQEVSTSAQVLPTPNQPATGTYWQQHVDYKMEIDMDVNTYQYNGKQNLVYTNNSPDVLNKVYYHLFFNAFQPGSDMDARIQSIEDPDGRMTNNLGTKENPIYESRISKLKPNEIGYIKVTDLKQDGKVINYNVAGTILEVTLANPIQPGESTTLDMVFNAQVPVQVRRSGRNSSEGVALSMAQWYPKLAEYDFEGWHADPYIGREFHGVWGDFDLKLTIDRNYIVGGTGYLQNPNEIGYGYETGEVNRPNTDKLTWHFVAPNVHDFTWAADPDYIHDTLQVENGPLLHFLYKNNPEIKENWKNLQPKTAGLMTYFSETIGEYPYKQYSVIQGGDGGMEYAMSTLITGERSFGSLVGVTAHEIAHTWFQFLLATNESKHEWMDEGFTSYISEFAVDAVNNTTRENPIERAYQGYTYLAKSGKEKPQTTHSDRFETNFAYGIAAYNKGAVFLSQLGYVIGEDNLKNTLKQYYIDWAFKHPTPNDFIRVAEKVSGLHLGWYLTDWTKTTNTIDYGVKSIDNTTIKLERIGLMPMPLDLEVTYTDGTTEAFYIPLQMMRGEKPTTATIVSDWSWAHPNYTFTTTKAVKSVVIDPKGLMADINRDNNTK